MHTLSTIFVITDESSKLNRFYNWIFLYVPFFKFLSKYPTPHHLITVLLMVCGYGMHPKIFVEFHFQPILRASNLVVAISNIGSMLFFQDNSLLHHMPHEQHQIGFLDIPWYLFLEFLNDLIPGPHSLTCPFLCVSDFLGHLYTD